MTIRQVTASGEEHGLMDEFSNSVPFDDFKNVKADYKESLRKKKKDDAKLVDVEYINMRSKVERLEMTYCKYAGDPLQRWKFIPYRKYRVPKGLADQVNSLGMPMRSGLVSLDDKEINQGAPLEKDREGEVIHRLVATTY